MAFTGAAVFEQVSDNIMRISGLSLASTVNGTLSLSTGAGAVKMPASFQPRPYGSVDLIEGVWLTYEAATTAINAIRLRTVKTLPAGELLITITNDDAANASPGLIIYVHFH
jgi:hypothetical protein